ncbi:hypothetical protein SSS_03939 [Sarcoptes scabiei]|uniref:Uncharacterized protein n=2 Tax=Sarcoptes scabiei TaxID=52283 RepID=A0A834VIS0_SARSC|nr:hypothetical protein SSS_03939 [Sarcoptes scabiei]UXI14189.1 hypothetical protein NH340_JMT00132 [Sarcoptes scabiei]
MNSIMRSILMMIFIITLIYIGVTKAFKSPYKMALINSIKYPHEESAYVRTKAYIRETPEIGISIRKVPIMVPLPRLIFRRNKQLIAKPITMPICTGCSPSSIQFGSTKTNAVALPFTINYPNQYSQSYLKSTFGDGFEK